MTKCVHKGYASHAAPKLCVASCLKCGRQWKGDPSKPQAPRWVKTANAARMAEILASAKK